MAGPASTARRRRCRKKANSQATFSIDSSRMVAEMVSGINEDLYNRIMQWDDSGAAEAFHSAAEERRLAGEGGNALWVPKLKSELYVEPVDCDQGKLDKVACDTVDAREDLTADKKREKPMPIFPFFSDSRNGTKISRVLNDPTSPPGVGSTAHCYPVLADAILEESANGIQLLVGGQPFEPTGWGEDLMLQEETGRQILDTGPKDEFPAFSDKASLPSVGPLLDEPVLVEAVLEESPSGMRLMVGGQLVEPSGWGEEGDFVWPQLEEQGFVEAILEESEDGRRLLVDGCPMKPSGDLVDMDLAQNAYQNLSHKDVDACISNVLPWMLGSQVIGCEKLSCVTPWCKSLCEAQQ